MALTGVVFALRNAFDRDKVTKKFYDQFKKEHADFLKFIKGIPVEPTGSGTPRSCSTG